MTDGWPVEDSSCDNGILHGSIAESEHARIPAWSRRLRCSPVASSFSALQTRKQRRKNVRSLVQMPGNYRKKSGLGTGAWQIFPTRYFDNLEGADSEKRIFCPSNTLSDAGTFPRCRGIGPGKTSALPRTLRYNSMCSLPEA